MGPLEWFNSLLGIIQQVVNLIQPFLSRSLSHCVHPTLRDADVLQHYAGATPMDVRHKSRVLRKPVIPMRLNYDLYGRQLADGVTYFNFGISNEPYARESLRNPQLQVRFPRVEGLVVRATANAGEEPWTAILDNEVYTFHFPTINPGEAYSGTGVLRVTFPQRGTYLPGLPSPVKTCGRFREYCQ